MTTTILNIRISEFEKLIPKVSGLLKKTDYDAKISDIERKYFTTSDYNKFTSNMMQR